MVLLDHHIGCSASSLSTRSFTRVTASNQGTPGAFHFPHYKAFPLLCLPLSLCQNANDRNWLFCDSKSWINSLCFSLCWLVFIPTGSICVSLCNHHPDQDMEHFQHPEKLSHLFPDNTQLPKLHYPETVYYDFKHNRLVLPLLELNDTIRDYAACILMLLLFSC